MKTNENLMKPEKSHHFTSLKLSYLKHFTDPAITMAPPLAKKKKWLQELNEEPNVPLKYASDTSSYVLCVYCEKSFMGSQKSQLTQHLARELHKTNRELKKKRKAHQATLDEVLGGRPKAP